MIGSKNDTIVAVATANGRGSVGIVRISGQAVRTLAVKLLKKLPEPRYAWYTPFYGADDTVLDEGIALFFEGPNSFTGEDVLELQGHGGSAVLQLIVAACVALGARPAEAGEFTQRAFLNGKLDLVQAESIADLIDATSMQAARSAVRSLQGVFSQKIHQVVENIITLRVLIEATLDFPEEEIDFLQKARAEEQTLSLLEALQHIEHNAHQGKLLREGVHVVLIGQPNVGKSSLLNQLAGEEVAIVTPIAGTTRDAVREMIQIQGVPLHIIDTAGLRETSDIVEKIGIERTWQAIQQADVALLLIDVTRGENHDDHAILQQLPPHLPVIKLLNKIDLITPEQRAQFKEKQTETCYAISAKTGLGMEIVKYKLLELAGWQNNQESTFIARTRHLEAIRTAHTHLAQGLMRLHTHHFELFAEETRLAQNALSTITGEFTSDDLLGEIFSRFCIGK